MRILVLGAGGLLGSHFCANYPENTIPIFHKDCDLLDLKSIQDTFEKHTFDVVVNCAGAVPKNTGSNLAVNSIGVHNLLKVCNDEGVKLVHISTDCVFSGNRGNYTEKDFPDPNNEYGKSKSAGEFGPEDYHLLIRTSFVGYPDMAGRGLLEWLFYQTTAPGYVNSLWNGCTVTHLSRWLMYHLQQNTKGILHLSTETISKFTLLSTVSDVFEWGVRLYASENPVVNRTLQTARTVTDWEYRKVPFVRQVEEMRGKEWRYNRWWNE